MESGELPAPLAPADSTATPSTRLEVATSTKECNEAVLEVRVVAKETGAGLAGIQVVVRGTRASLRTNDARWHGRAGETQKTDANGRVEYAVPSGEAFELVANVGNAHEAGRVHQEASALVPGERRDLVVELPTDLDFVWFGRIVDGESSRPLAGARVERVAGNPFKEHTGQATAIGDTNGTVQLAFASWTTTYARVEHPGYASGFVHLERGDEQASSSCTVALFRSAALDVLVTDPGGTPHVGLQVRVTGKPRERVQEGEFESFHLEEPACEAQTGADGRCALEGLPANVTLTVELFAGEKLLRSEDHSVRLQPGERRALNERVAW